MRQRLLEAVLVVVGLGVLAVSFTWPLALHLGTRGYKLHTVGDAQYSVWNVAWVAHALLTDPRHVLDANIFYPERQTLVYSEANLLAGALAAPVYWLTGNAFAAHNFVVLLSFVLSGASMYYLARHLSGDHRAAAIAAIGFAFCPFVFGHLPHIQLLMTFGLPLSLLAFHRVAAQPTIGRGVALGAAMAAQGLACAYYAVFDVLLIGFATLFTAFAPLNLQPAPAAADRLYRNRRYWTAIAAGAVVSLAIMAPLMLAYLRLQSTTGYTRELGESSLFAATWSSYLTSSSFVWSWLHRMLEAPTDQLFPGILLIAAGGAGAVIGWVAGGRQRYLAALYGSMTALALWESFGPAGGLYATTYRLPLFSFVRAPSRFGIVVALGLAALTSMSLAAAFRRTAVAEAIAPVLMLAAIVDVATPVPITPVPQIETAYYVLARQPEGALLEMPPLSRGFAFTRTRYMINSTVHWKPLVNAYSDVIPASFSQSLNVLATFPSLDAFRILERDRVRYVSFDVAAYRQNPRLYDDLVRQLAAFDRYLRKLHDDDHVWLYEIVAYPR
jgi:hypothetical protein